MSHIISSFAIHQTYRSYSELNSLYDSNAISSYILVKTRSRLGYTPKRTLSKPDRTMKHRKS